MSGNYRAPPAASPSGGGVLPPRPQTQPAVKPTPTGPQTQPVKQTMGGPMRMPASMSTMRSFEDGGGVIPDDVEDQMNDGPPDQGAGAATVDPMSIVKGALSFGRKAMGLPAAFFGGDQQEQGFDDGGEVQDDKPDQGMIPSGQDQATGGGQMPDPRKTLEYLTGAGAISPEQAQALEAQVDPQGQMDGSERKLKAMASAGSPQAQFGYLQHMRQQFTAFGAGARAAASGGQGRPANPAEAAAAATQAFENVPTGHSIKFAPGRGGMVMMARKHGAAQAMEGGGLVDRLPDGEESTNVEDRRGDTVEGTVPKDVKWFGDEAQSGKRDDPKDEGVRKKQSMSLARSFDDGGEVEEDAPGEIPNDVTAAVTEPDAGGEGGVIPTEPSAEGAAPAPDEGGSDQPTMLTPEQFDKLVQPETFEKATEKGWGDVVGSILGAMNPMGTANAAEMTGTGAPPKRAAGADNDQALMDRFEAQANRLYPNVSQGPQRRAYMQHMMDREHEQSGKVDLETSKNRAGLQAQRESATAARDLQKQNSDLTRDREKQGSIDARAAAGRDAKTQQVQKMIEAKDRASLMNFVRSEANSLRVADPKITPQKIIDHISKTFNVDPNIIATQAKEALSPDTGAWPAQPGGQQGPPQSRAGSGANMDAATPGTEKPYTKNGVTRQYKFGEDGQWHLMPEQPRAFDAMRTQRSGGLGRD